MVEEPHTEYLQIFFHPLPSYSPVNRFLMSRRFSMDFELIHLIYYILGRNTSWLDCRTDVCLFSYLHISNKQTLHISYKFISASGSANSNQQNKWKPV